jgi:NitT/TauT family transport system substrate-binding protein
MTSREALLLALLLAALLLGGGAAEGAERASTSPLRLQLLWTPQSQFAGYYLAADRGIYARHGLQVEILPGGPGLDPVARLAAGEADFAILWLTSALAARDRGVPLSHLAQVFATSNLEILAWKDRGLTRIRDLDGRRMSLWGEPFRPAYSAFFRSQGISPVLVPQHYTVNLFLRRGVDACSVMGYNERHAVFQAGIDEAELVRFSLRDHGIDIPEDGLYCREETRRARPEACRALAAASLEGWRLAREHPEEALDSVMRRVDEARLPTNRTHMRYMLSVVLGSVFPATGAAGKAAPAPGVLSEESYRSAARWMVDLGLIGKAPSHTEFVR